MKRITKIALVSSLLVGGLGAAAAAVSGPGCDDGQMGGWGRHGSHSAASPEERAANMEQRLERFENKLQLTAEQKPAWDAFAAKLRARAEAMIARRDAMRQQTDGDLMDRFDQRVAMMQEMLGTLQDFRTEVQDLLQVLTPEQKALVEEHFNHSGMRHMRHGF